MLPPLLTEALSFGGERVVLMLLLKQNKLVILAMKTVHFSATAQLNA